MSEQATSEAADGRHVEQVVTINRSPAELYEFWRDFSRLPQFMAHLEAVTVQDATHSHWVAKAPAGQTVAWDAEITSDQPNEAISWQSVGETSVPNRGEVRFAAGPAGRGTTVRVHLHYSPPAGAVGALVAKLFGEEPNQQVAEDLRRFKRLMETGEIATIDGQSAGERSALGKLVSNTLERGE